MVLGPDKCALFGMSSHWSRGCHGGTESRPGTEGLRQSGYIVHCSITIKTAILQSQLCSWGDCEEARLEQGVCVCVGR